MMLPAAPCPLASDPTSCEVEHAATTEGLEGLGLAFVGEGLGLAVLEPDPVPGLDVRGVGVADGVALPQAARRSPSATTIEPASEPRISHLPPNRLGPILTTSAPDGLGS